MHMCGACDLTCWLLAPKCWRWGGQPHAGAPYIGVFLFLHEAVVRGATSLVGGHAFPTWAWPGVTFRMHLHPWSTSDATSGLILTATQTLISSLAAAAPPASCSWEAMAGLKEGYIVAVDVTL